MAEFRQQRPNRRVISAASRRGAVLPIVAMFLVVLVAMAAFSMDLAYIELVKVQLRAATDSAAKAGTCALVQGKSVTDAQSAAINMAALNTVNGKPLRITTTDITFGQSVRQSDGTYQFVAGIQPYQSTQVTSSLTNSNSNGSVKLFFAPFIGTKKYSPTDTAVATAYACEVCLVLDRSHSMCWDDSGNQWNYPAPIYSNSQLGIKSAPQPGSRWLALNNAISSFTSILQAANSPPRVAVVTWASTIGTNTYEYQVTGLTSPAVTTDVQLTSNMSSVNSAVNSYTQHVLLGATNMAAGIEQGNTVLTGSNVRPFAKKIMILMTDGQWNTGNDPLDAATDALAANITIHCVCFLKNADQTTCQNVASLTGGKFYYATDSAGLTAAFQQLAYSLPIVLTK